MALIHPTILHLGVPDGNTTRPRTLSQTIRSALGVAQPMSHTCALAHIHIMDCMVVWEPMFFARAVRGRGGGSSFGGGGRRAPIAPDSKAAMHAPKLCDGNIVAWLCLDCPTRSPQSNSGPHGGSCFYFFFFFLDNPRPMWVKTGTPRTSGTIMPKPCHNIIAYQSCKMSIGIVCGLVRY